MNDISELALSGLVASIEAMMAFEFRSTGHFEMSAFQALSGG